MLEANYRYWLSSNFTSGSHRGLWQKFPLAPVKPHWKIDGILPKRALPAMLTHGKWVPFGRIPSKCGWLLCESTKQEKYNHNKTKHNKAICIFHGMYCTHLWEVNHWFHNIHHPLWPRKQSKPIENKTHACYYFMGYIRYLWKAHPPLIPWHQPSPMTATKQYKTKHDKTLGIFHGTYSTSPWEANHWFHDTSHLLWSQQNKAQQSTTKHVYISWDILYISLRV